jgi:predicted O-linked N-acetylglucosamine transferase (SPINDLY family)
MFRWFRKSAPGAPGAIPDPLPPPAQPALAQPAPAKPMPAQSLRGAQAGPSNAQAGSSVPLHEDRALSQRLKAEGNALFGEGRLQEAAACFERALAAWPGHAAAHFNLGLVRREQGLLDAACEAFAAAWRADASMADAPQLLGSVRLAQGRVADAMAALRAALAVDPSLEAASCDLALALIYHGELAEADAVARAALIIHPRSVELQGLLGEVALRQGDAAAALAALEPAVAADPSQAELHERLGQALALAGHESAALASFERALAREPGRVDALAHRAAALEALGRTTEAAQGWHAAADAALADDWKLGNLIESRYRVCDWRGSALLVERAAQALREHRRAIHPFSWLAVSDDAALQRRASAIHAAAVLPAGALDPVPAAAGSAPAPTPGATGATGATATLATAATSRTPPDRIRIAYLSADFHAHATAFLMAEFFERHNRARFELTALSFGPDSTHPMRQRLVRAFDRFEDVRALTDREVAQRLQALDIDIAIDLKGYTTDARPGVWAHRGAPLQVAWVGYPGTLGADAWDYLLADAQLVGTDDASFYSEQVVRLPSSYQPNDRMRLIAPQVPTRAALGLPEAGFVFCCFNNNYKITPEVFSVWMRLLQAVPGSVLWLLQDNALAMRNLRREAQARGVDAQRLVFAARAPLDEHLARHAQADLFLDTLPCNAHTTASDALWAGLPVLTCKGQAFAARVAASLLHAVGLPELVMHSLAEYEARALALARDPGALATLRRTLQARRADAPLFDAATLCRQVESAYETMVARSRGGLPPSAFDVPAEAAGSDGAG